MTPAFDNTLLTRPLDRHLALEVFNTLGQQAQALGLTLRAPPPEPTSCCGRGCSGCVWEGFLDAARFWREDAWLAIQDAP
jgi:hypothetical protein